MEGVFSGRFWWCFSRKILLGDGEASQYIFPLFTVVYEFLVHRLCLCILLPHVKGILRGYPVDLV